MLLVLGGAGKGGPRWENRLKADAVPDSRKLRHCCYFGNHGACVRFAHFTEKQLPSGGI